MVREVLSNPDVIHIHEERQRIRSMFIEHYRTAGYLIHPSVPLLSGNTDPSVIFIGSSTNVLKPFLMQDELPKPGIALYQPKLRQQNTRAFYTQEPIEFLSYFSGGGVLAPIETATLTSQVMIAFIEYYLGVPASKLIARVSSIDVDLIDLWSSVGVTVEIDGKDPDQYKWQFGSEQLSGRGMMLAIDTGGIPEEFSSVVVIYKNGSPFAYEWGYGTETTLAKKYGLRHPVYATPMSDLMSDIGESDLSIKLADVIYACAALIDAGILPGNMGSKFHGANTIFVRYLQALNVFSREMDLSSEQSYELLLRILDYEFPNYSSESYLASQLFVEKLRAVNDRFEDAIKRYMNGDAKALIELRNVKFELERTGKIDLTRLVKEYRYLHFYDSKLAKLLQQRGLLVDGDLVV